MFDALGALLFLLVTGALTLGLVALLLRGLALAWAESQRTDALARQEGWHHLGSAVFTGPGGENDWRGGLLPTRDDGRKLAMARACPPLLRLGADLLVETHRLAAAA